MIFSKTLISRCRQTDMRPTVFIAGNNYTGDKLIAGVVVTGDKLYATCTLYYTIKTKSIKGWLALC